MRRARQPCARPGCPDPAVRLGRCSTHASHQDQYYRATTPTKRARRTNDVRRHRANAVAAHRARQGDWCPGYGVAGHASTDLTADDPTPIAKGGNPHQPLVVLCRACNGRKAATLIKQR